MHTNVATQMSVPKAAVRAGLSDATCSPSSTMELLPSEQHAPMSPSAGNQSRLKAPSIFAEAPTRSAPLLPDRPHLSSTAATQAYGASRTLLYRLLLLGAAPVLLLLLLPSLIEVAVPDAATSRNDVPSCVPANIPSGVVARCLDEARGFPLLVTPPSEGMSLQALESWLETNDAVVARWVTEYGAVLFRGFTRPAEADLAALAFERVAERLIAPLPLADFYLGR